MGLLALLVLLGVPLGPPFGDAAATAVPSSDGLVVTVDVELSTVPFPDVVVVHLVYAGQQQTFPLARTGPDRFGGSFPAPAANGVVAFEAGWGSERYEESPAVTLLELGVDAELLGVPIPTRQEPAGTTRSWLLLILGVAAALAAALLVLLARRPIPPPDERVESGPPSDRSP